MGGVTDLVDLVRRKYQDAKEYVGDPVETVKKKIEDLKTNPKSRPAFIKHNEDRIDKGLPPLTYTEFADLTGEK